MTGRRQHAHDHHGARSEQFDLEHAHRLDDPERFRYLPPEAIVGFVDAPPRGLVVDYGAGTGTYALAFAQARPDCEVVAIDVQPELLAMLRAKPGANRVRAGEPELLDAHAGKIDRLFGINVLHHLAPDDLRRLFGALPAHARVAFLDWNADVERPVGPRHNDLYGASEAQRYLATFGFVVERTLTLPYHYGFYGRIS